VASHYARGRRAEWRTRDYIKGLLPDATVIRSAGSKGPIDLVVITKHGFTLVQVKTGPKKPKPAPLLPTGQRVSVAWWKPRASEPEIIEQEALPRAA
jgi:hypothetical protein